MTAAGRPDDPTSRLNRPELVPLVDELARRLGDGDDPVVLTLRRLPLAARQAVADLFGLDRLPPPTAGIRVSRLVEILGLASVAELRDEVEALRGVLPDRRAERSADRAARMALWDWLDGEAATVWPAVGGQRDGRTAWVERLRSQGARGGVEVHRLRLDRALRVLRALPADGVGLPSFANDLLDDPHALDRGRHLAAIVLDAVALAAGAVPATNAEAARRLWESVGVAPDPLSSTVLTLGVGVASGVGPPSPLGAWLAASADAGEPVVLTLSQLRRWPVPALAPDATAYVVENPSLVAEAARLGWSGPPLVCSSGRPTVAVVTLVRQLAGRGATVSQHADFDAAGLAITAWLAERAGTVPWRMTAADYGAAAGPAPSDAGAASSALGILPPTGWDPHLAGAMRHRGVAVYEEQLRRQLLDAMVSETRCCS